jgi:hypothetical protein
MERWLQIYRDYTAAALDDEIAWLQKQSRNLFQSQAEGDRSYARSTAEVRDRLAAALQVKRERGVPPSVGDGNLVADFSGVQP